MPGHNCVGLYDQQGGTPVAPDSRQDRPEDAIALPETRSLGLLAQDGQLLPQGEVLCGQIDSVAKKAPYEGEHQLNHAHFTAPNSKEGDATSVSGLFSRSTRNSLRHNEYGFFGRHRKRRLSFNCSR